MGAVGEAAPSTSIITTPSSVELEELEESAELAAWAELAARAVWVVWVELAARAVWVAQVSHSPRQAAPVDVRTGNTSPSIEAARLTRIGQPRTDSAEAPVVTP